MSTQITSSDQDDLSLSFAKISGADEDILKQIPKKDKMPYVRVGVFNLLVSLIFGYAAYKLLGVFFNPTNFWQIFLGVFIFILLLAFLKLLTRRLINKDSSESKFSFFTVGFILSLVIAMSFLFGGAENKRVRSSAGSKAIYDSLMKFYNDRILANRERMINFSDSLNRVKALIDSPPPSKHFYNDKERIRYNDSMRQLYPDGNDTLYKLYVVDTFLRNYLQFFAIVGDNYQLLSPRDSIDLKEKSQDVQKRLTDITHDPNVASSNNYRQFRWGAIPVLNHLRMIKPENLKSLAAYYDPDQFKKQAFSEQFNYLLKNGDTISVIIFILFFLVFMVAFLGIYSVVESHDKDFYHELLGEKEKLNSETLLKEREKIVAEFKFKSEFKTTSTVITELGKTEVGNESLKKLAEGIDNISPESLKNAAEFERLRSNYDKALEYINRAIELDNKTQASNEKPQYNPDLYAIKAGTLKSMGLTLEATDAEETAEKIRNENSYVVNKGKKIKLDRLTVENVSIFDNFTWNFRPGINILLGRNGYGKSHLLALIIAMLYNDKKKRQDWTKNSPSNGKASLCLAGDVPGREIENELLQKTKLIAEKQDALDNKVSEFTSQAEKTTISDEMLRGRFKAELDEIASVNNDIIILQEKLQSYRDTIVVDANTIRTQTGFVPILAIPDSRFVDKSNESIKASSGSKGDLGRNGAEEFLYSKPYAHVIENVLFKTCLSYFEKGKTFSIEPFGLIQRVIKELSSDRLIVKDGQLVYQDESKFEFKAIEGDDKTGSFSLRVQPEDVPVILPIQKVSQGTFSIVAICCLIYNYLVTIYGEKRDILNQQAMVIIDELDAHIHPTWQKKLVMILRKNFPNVQFIISAHSPLMVWGCKANEVSVFRRTNEGKFRIETINRSLLGLSLENIYSKIFEVEGKDVELLRYKELYTYLENYKVEFDQLKKRNEISDLPTADLLRMAELQDLIENAGLYKAEYDKLQDRKAKEANEISNFIDKASKSLTKTIS